MTGTTKVKLSPAQHNFLVEMHEIMHSGGELRRASNMIRGKKRFFVYSKDPDVFSRFQQLTQSTPETLHRLGMIAQGEQLNPGAPSQRMRPWRWHLTADALAYLREHALNFFGEDVPEGGFALTVALMAGDAVLRRDGNGVAQLHHPQNQYCPVEVQEEQVTALVKALILRENLEPTPLGRIWLEANGCTLAQ